MALAIGLFRNILPFPYQYVLNPCYVAMAEGGNERPQIAGISGAGKSSFDNSGTYRQRRGMRGQRVWTKG